MYRAAAYILVAIVMTCFLAHAIAPIGGALNATMNTVARTLRRGADDASQ